MLLTACGSFPDRIDRELRTGHPPRGNRVETPEQLPDPTFARAGNPVNNMIALGMRAVNHVPGMSVDLTPVEVSGS
ncbi:hypothetical protein [Micromonospora sp. WMMD708]|uniref:hypothetical protein n=1 Tax=Micromonospora sp. WMMD708 TaxID=3403464 RepID=UPI003BF50D4B